MQAILLTSSLLIVVAMIGSLVWLATLRVPAEVEAPAAESGDKAV